MLDVRRLTVLREVALHGSLAAAARALAFTPSAVSQQVSALEREAGVPLIERSRSGVELTDAGRALVARTESILAELSGAQADLEAIVARRSGVLRIGAFPTAGFELVPAAIVAFAAQYPGVELRLVELEPELSLPRLRLGELDLAVAFECDYVPLPLDSGFEQETLFREPMLVLCQKRRVDADEPLDLRELAGQSWIAPDPGSTIHEFTVRICQAAGFEPAIASIWNDFRVVRVLVSAGVGVAFAPQIAATPTQGVVAREIQGSPGRRVFAAWRPGTARAPLVEALIGAFRAAVPAVQAISAA